MDLTDTQQAILALISERIAADGVDDLFLDHLGGGVAVAVLRRIFTHAVSGFGGFRRLIATVATVALAERLLIAVCTHLVVRGRLDDRGVRG